MKATIRDAVVIIAGLLLLGLAARTLDTEAGGRELLDQLGHGFRTPPSGLMATGTGFGILLLGSWLVGRAAAAIKLPKITGYLLFGIVIGPSTAPVIIREDQLQYLRLVNDLAIALIALTAGSEIRIDFVRRSLSAITSVLVFQVAAILAAVTVVVYLALPAMGLDGVAQPRDRFWIAVIFATIATASSPAVVIAIVTDTKSKGTMGQVSLAVTVSKDLILVILFAIIITLGASALIGVAEGGGGSHGGTGGVAEQLAIELGGSLVAGVIVGLFMALYLHRLNAHLAIFVVFSCFGIALVSESLHLEPLIVALIAGMMMKNLWRRQSEVLFDTVEELSLPVYCVFFSVAGCKADVNTLLLAGQWAVLIGVARAGAIWSGVHVGARLARLEPGTRRWLWSAFIPQAGVSLVLATRVKDTFEHDLPTLADGIYNLLLACIVLNEILGPLLFKLGLARGEAAEGAAAPVKGGSHPSESALE